MNCECECVRAGYSTYLVYTACIHLTQYNGLEYSRRSNQGLLRHSQFVQ